MDTPLLPPPVPELLVVVGAASDLVVGTPPVPVVPVQPEPLFTIYVVEQPRPAHPDSQGKSFRMVTGFSAQAQVPVTVMPMMH